MNVNIKYYKNKEEDVDMDQWLRTCIAFEED